MPQGFWKGFISGAITTFAVTYVMKRAPARHSGFNAISAWKTNGPQRVDPARIALKRDENSVGDPAALTGARTDTTASFERAGGAPGGSTPAESSEAPGRPGKPLDYTDANKPVKPSSRTLHLPKEPARKRTSRKARPKLPPNLPKTTE
ncbi:MAG: hypothetical protein ACR2JE_03960 [Acidobacteriaceae bacterium]